MNLVVCCFGAPGHLCTNLLLSPSGGWRSSAVAVEFSGWMDIWAVLGMLWLWLVRPPTYHDTMIPWVHSWQFFCNDSTAGHFIYPYLLVSDMGFHIHPRLSFHIHPHIPNFSGSGQSSLCSLHASGQELSPWAPTFHRQLSANHIISISIKPHDTTISIMLHIVHRSKLYFQKVSKGWLLCFPAGYSPYHPSFNVGSTVPMPHAQLDSPLKDLGSRWQLSGRRFALATTRESLGTSPGFSLPGPGCTDLSHSSTPGRWRSEDHQLRAMQRGSSAYKVPGSDDYDDHLVGGLIEFFIFPSI